MLGNIREYQRLTLWCVYLSIQQCFWGQYVCEVNASSTSQRCLEVDPVLHMLLRKVADVFTLCACVWWGAVLVSLVNPTVTHLLSSLPGDITQKGYEKKRTKLLAPYIIQTPGRKLLHFFTLPASCGQGRRLWTPQYSNVV